jgi:AbrB family looped-hinge helix DNA binding protein
MKTTIDKAGRVVIPAAIRSKAGFRAGMELEVLLDDASVRLIRAVPGPVIEKRGKRLVARPRLAEKERTPLDVAALIEEERERWPR